ncbi:MAG: DUF2764 domain-containing protein [Deltaproteobacteria bacterium]|nr:DUF2764 domain-containing protein [Deltaproteobacteria bacterium]
MAATYYTLVASLPRLVHFERAEWLPLSRKQLDQRLSMLVPEDAVQLRLAEALVQWQRQPITRTTQEMLRGYRLVMERASQPSLREFVDFRMSQRTALVALRRQRRGLGPPASGEIWGVGPWVRRIETHWDRADLGFGNILPWVEEARGLLEAGNATGLERLLMNAVWRQLSRMADPQPFGFEQVLAFVFKWDIVQLWLSYDADAAKTRFQQLIAEVTRDHQQLFT